MIEMVCQSSDGVHEQDLELVISDMCKERQMREKADQELAALTLQLRDSEQAAKHTTAELNLLRCNPICPSPHVVSDVAYF